MTSHGGEAVGTGTHVVDNAFAAATTRGIGVEVPPSMRRHPLIPLGPQPAIAGSCGLVFGGRGASAEPELAFELLPAVHNCGYATETGRAVISWGVQADYRRLWATVWDWNSASRRVLEKLRFRETAAVSAITEHGRRLLTVLELDNA